MRRAMAGVLVVGMLSAGCSPSKPPHATGVRAGVETTFVVGESVEGRPLTCRLFGDRGPVVFALATIHGNEAAGTPLLRRVAQLIREDPSLVANRRVLLLEVANPDGFERNTRGNANGVDLNRNFPALNFSKSARHGSEPLSEPESRAIYELVLEYQPSRIISFHQPLACIDYEGGPTARALAERISRDAGLPVNDLSARDGSLGSYAGDKLGIPIITYELPREASDMSDEELWARYGKSTMTAIFSD